MHGLNIIKRLNAQEQSQVDATIEQHRRNVASGNTQFDRDLAEYYAAKSKQINAEAATRKNY